MGGEGGCNGGPGRVEMVTRRWSRNIDRNGVLWQFEPTVSKCKDEYINTSILKVMDRASKEYDFVLCPKFSFRSILYEITHVPLKSTCEITNHSPAVDVSIIALLR